jgi:hypothetical protein
VVEDAELGELEVGGVRSSDIENVLLEDKLEGD